MISMKDLLKYFTLFLVVIAPSCDKTETTSSTKVETVEAVDITDHTALCRGRIVNKGSGTILGYGIEMNDGSGYTQYFKTMTSGNDFEVQFTKLSRGKTYRYRAHIDDGAIQYGKEKQFSTQKGLYRDVTIDSITITGNSAIIDFENIDRYYKEWGIHYSATEATENTPSKSETLQPSIILDGLNPTTTYYILPFVVDNNSQTFYLEKFSFTNTNGIENLELAGYNMHPINQLKFVKYKIAQQVEPYYSAFRKVFNDANTIIHTDQKENAIADFYIPGYYTYPETHKTNVAGMVSDSYAAYVNALAYRLSGNKKYGQKVVYFLNAWSSKNKKYSAYDGELSMTRAGCRLMIAAELMTDTGLCSTNIYQKAGNSIRNRKNNWAEWGRCASMLSAFFTGNITEANENVRLMKSDLFDKIAPDGHTPEEVGRNANGTWYTYFSLSPLTAAAWIAYNMTGKSIFAMESSTGASIKKAVDYFLYYVERPTKWSWHSNPTKGNPYKWPGNLAEALYGIYKNPACTNYVIGSRPVVYNDHHFTWTFPALMPTSLTEYELNN